MRYKAKYQTNTSNWKENGLNATKNFQLLREIDQRQAEKGGSLLYRYIVCSVYDSKVFYQITQLNHKTVVIEICDGICLDGYTDERFGRRSVIPISMAKRMLEGRIALENLFLSK